MSSFAAYSVALLSGGWLLGVWTMCGRRSGGARPALDDRELLARRTLGFWIR